MMKYRFELAHLVEGHVHVGHHDNSACQKARTAGAGHPGQGGRELPPNGGQATAGQSLNAKFAQDVANGLNAGSNRTDRKNALEQGSEFFVQAHQTIAVPYCVWAQTSLSTNDHQIANLRVRVNIK